MQSVKARCGGFAKVYPGQLNDPEQSGPAAIYALKEIIITDENRLKMTANEIRILKGLKHTNIVILEEALFDKSDPGTVYLAMSPWAPETLEYCLSSVMSGNYKHEWCRPGTLGHWPSIVVQCLEGLSYLHGQKIKHKDIKPHNILLQQIKNNPTGNYEIRPIITDFNISKDNYDGHGLTDRSGTLQFKAPEQLGTKPSATLLSDIWSLGCCFAFIFILIHSSRENLTTLWDKVMNPTGSGFYDPDNLKELYEIIKTEGNKTTDVSTAVFIQGFGDLVKSMLKEDFKKRTSAEIALSDMRELEARLGVLKLGLPSIHICLNLGGHAFVKTIKSAQLRPSTEMIRDCVAEFQRQRHKIIPAWLGSTTTIVDVTMIHRQRPRPGDGVSTIQFGQKSHWISSRHEEHRSDWTGSDLFYQELLRFSKNTTNKDNIPWELALRIHETRLKITSLAYIGLILYGSVNAVILNWLGIRALRREYLSGAALWPLVFVVFLLGVPVSGLKPRKAIRERRGYEHYAVVST